MSRIRLALAIVSIFATGIVGAQSVSHSCVGEIKPDGSLDRSACTTFAPSGGAGGLNPSQQLQLQGAQAVTNAVSGALANMLSPDPAAKLKKEQEERQQRLDEQRRQEELAEKKRKKEEAARLRFQAGRDQTLQGLKGDGAQTQTARKSDGLPTINDPNCVPARLQDGTTWGTCVASDGHRYCVLCKNGPCSRVSCYGSAVPVGEEQQQKALQQLRQQQLVEQKRQKEDAERLRFQQARDQTVRGIKGDGAPVGDQLTVGGMRLK